MVKCFPRSRDLHVCKVLDKQRGDWEAHFKANKGNGWAGRTGSAVLTKQTLHSPGWNSDWAVVLMEQQKKKNSSELLNASLSALWRRKDASLCIIRTVHFSNSFLVPASLFNFTTQWFLLRWICIITAWQCPEHCPDHRWHFSASFLTCLFRWDWERREQVFQGFPKCSLFAFNNAVILLHLVSEEFWIAFFWSAAAGQRHLQDASKGEMTSFPAVTSSKPVCKNEIILSECLSECCHLLTMNYKITEEILNYY